MRNAAAAVLAAALFVAACGEPAPDIALPERSGDAHVADEAGVFDAQQRSDLEDHLAQIAAGGLDIAALTYETEQANCGEAYRAAKRFVQAWDADVALVAVAAPGDFDATEEARKRCLGVQPRDERAIPGALREQIAETLVPPKAADNDWYGAFVVAADALASQ